METLKSSITVSNTHRELGEAIERGLKIVSEKLIAETKATNGYLVIADAEGNLKKVPAKDL